MNNKSVRWDVVIGLIDSTWNNDLTITNLHKESYIESLDKTLDIVNWQLRKYISNIDIRTYNKAGWIRLPNREILETIAISVPVTQEQMIYIRIQSKLFYPIVRE